MNHKFLLKAVSLSFMALFLAVGVQAQALITYDLTIGDQEYVVTKDIDQMFLGTYTANIGDEQKHYTISLDDNTDFEWGVGVNEDKLSIIDIMEYSNGKMISYEAYVLYFHDKITDEKGELMLYELDGKKFLGQAQKEESVAGNR